MTIDAEARSKIADIIYELNVEPDEVDAVVDQIEAVLPSKIEIDMAGAMEKITPEMVDHTRDVMIEALTRRCTQMMKALKPFADKVFNDNGDIMVQDIHLLDYEDFTRAYFACKGSDFMASEPESWCTDINGMKEDGMAKLVTVMHNGKPVVTMGGWDKMWSMWVYIDPRVPTGTIPTAWMETPEAYT